MIQKNHLPIIFILMFLLVSAAFAEEKPDPFIRRLGKSLEANRSLLKNHQSECLRLKIEARLNPSPKIDRQIMTLEAKMKVLRQDAQALESFLPPGAQAQTFLLDLITQKTNTEKMKQSETAADLLQETSLRQKSRAGFANGEPIYQMHERALAHVANKEFDQALSIYEDIVLRSPEDDEAYIIMGHTYLLTGRYEKAERAFHNAASIDPANIREITPFYENLVLQNPDDDKAYADLGYAYMITGDLLKAQTAFGESLTINPSNVAAQTGLYHTHRLLNNA